MLYKLTISILTLFVLSACCTAYTQSFCCAPMECKGAKDGFAEYTPVIKALESYKKDNHQYPLSLEQLYPTYLKSVPDVSNKKLTYNGSGSSFELIFLYKWPGVNNCIYSSEVSNWNCRGHF